MSKYSYGYKPSPKDERDFIYFSPTIQLPDSVDLRSQTSPVRDQGQLGSCTAFAIGTGMREFLQIKNKGKSSVLSPQFLYYEERRLEGTVNEDSGAYPRDGFKTLLKKGICLESKDKYNIYKFTKKPSLLAYVNALSYKIKAYHRLNTLQDIQTCLAGGYGVVIGFDVYESFESIGSDGLMPMPQPGEQLLGGHAVFVVGYRVDNNLIVKNSWGTGWRDAGFFYMPFNYVTSQNVSDIWTAV